MGAKFTIRGRLATGIFLFAIFFSTLASAQTTSQTCASQLAQSVSQQIDGLLPIYQFTKDGTPVLGIPKNGLDTKYILSSYITQGGSEIIGDYSKTSIIRFEYKDKKIDVVETFGNLIFSEGSPLARTQKASFSDSRILSLTTLSCSDDIYIFAILNDASLKHLGLMALQGLRAVIGSVTSAEIEASLGSIKAYKDNINLTIDLQLNTSRYVPSAANGRNISTRASHSIMRLPDDNFKARLADPSIGYLTVNRSDLSQLNLRDDGELISRWRLEKKDPDAAVSDPVKPIVFWIENTTPYSFREPIRNGALAWNEAFEAAGISNAVEVKIQPDDAQWDAGDFNYNVIRWEVSPGKPRLGYGPSVADPRTGEILSADILLNFSSLTQRFGYWLTLLDYNWIDQRAPNDDVAFINQPVLTSTDLASANDNTYQGQSTPDQQSSNDSAASIPANKIRSFRLSKSDVQPALSDVVRFAGIIGDVTGNTAHARQDQGKILSPLSNHDQSNAIPASLSNANESGIIQQENFSERMIRELITYLTMHEVGHTLGLAHNFAGSRYRAYSDIHDQEKTDGVVSGSVMDYVPINFAPPGVVQGDFANTRLGPYDIWAIRFGYGPAIDTDDSARATLLREATLPGNHFSIYPADPHNQTYDLTDDPTAYALDSLRLAQSLITQSEDWSANESELVNVRVFAQILQLRGQALLAMTAQLWPLQFRVDDAFFQSGRNRMIKAFIPKADQLSALDALKAGIFDADDWAVPAPLNQRLGYYSNSQVTMDGGQSAYIEFLLQDLMSPTLLATLNAAQEQGANALLAEDYLKQVRAMVFGHDLGPTANPTAIRRAQQYSYVSKLMAISRTARYARLDDATSSVARVQIRRQVQKEVDALKRELFLPYFWASDETKLHRQQLRDLLR